MPRDERRRCRKCRGMRVYPDEFAKDDRRSGGVGSCLLCVAEQAKLSNRLNVILPRFEAEIPTWPTIKLESEVDFLEAKLAMLREVLKQRV